MIVHEDSYLEHYGTKRHSGRYPWGSGGNESKRNADFISTVNELKKSGLSEAKQAEALGINTTQLRARISIASNQQRQEKINQAQRLKDKGYSNTAIGERMGVNESTVRGYLAPGAANRADVLRATSNMLKDQVDKHGLIDVGRGVEQHVGVSRTKLDTSVAMLKEEGYEVHTVKIPQAGTGELTTNKVLAKPGTPWVYVKNNIDQISIPFEHTEDGGHTYVAPKPPLSISSKRVAVRYAEEGGAEADGVIFVRPGVKDTHLGGANYAQVRIAVDGTHYLKGMAVYKDDLPKGVDLMFNTNKSNTGNKHDAMKKLSDDPENPFTSSVRQITDEHGKVISVMNKVGIKEGTGEEGGWDKWSRNLPSQMLSKQNPDFAKAQLTVAAERRRKELADISALTNPAVKRRLLRSFSDETDAAAVHLRAAAIPRQATKVILPLTTVKEGEVYAPSFNNGERVALVRFPHGGKFEIPQLTVNNKNPEGRKLLGTNARDAIGIHHKVAERLSGADFDGDTVLVIPNNKGLVKSESPLEGLKGFDPKASFPPYHGMRTIDGGTYNAHTKEPDYPIVNGRPKKNTSSKGQKMGDVSNLITDMTVHGASHDEIARAVRHSMVVIDAEKHHLDVKGSYNANGIAALKERYQGRGPKGNLKGASTLLSRASARIDVPKRTPRPAKDGGPIDKATGQKKYVPKENNTYVDKNGKTRVGTFRSKQLAETHDARTLISHQSTRIEGIYADHSNRLKAMANEARKEMVNTRSMGMNPSAKVTYAKEVESLNSQLALAKRNAPLERQAQRITDTQVKLRKQANPDLEPDDVKKIRNQELVKARIRTGASKHQINISDREWQAIQAGAISNHKLDEILNNADLTRVRELATPHERLVMTPSKLSRAKQMLDMGYTQAEVADQLGVAVSTLNYNVDEKQKGDVSHDGLVALG